MIFLHFIGLPLSVILLGVVLANVETTERKETQ
jgi:hypothetical protein